MMRPDQSLTVATYQKAQSEASKPVTVRDGFRSLANPRKFAFVIVGDNLH